MKNVLRLLTFSALLLTFALPAFAQDAAQSGQMSAQDEEAKAALYKKWLDARNGDANQQKIAYEAGKEYMAKFGATPDAYSQAVQKWVAKYEQAVVDFNCNEALRNNDAVKAFDLCRPVLSKDQENLRILMALSRAGYVNAISKTPNKALISESTNVTRRAISLVESGKTVDSWAPFPNRDDALGWLYYTQGILVKDTSPEEAAQSFIKAAQSNSSVKKEPTTFFYLGNAYEDGEFKRLAAEYKANFPEGKEITDDVKPKYDQLIGQINQALDRMIDAYARAVALSTDPKLASFKNELTRKLTVYYKQRHEDSEAGLQDLIANVLSRPLPLPGQPTTPAAPPASTGAAATSGNTAAATTTATPAAGTQPAPSAAKPAATTGNPGAKPANPAPKPLTKSTTTAARAKSGRA